MFNFLKYRWFYAAISLALLIPGVYSLIRFGLNPSIDFVGGTTIELRSKQLEVENLKHVLKEKGVEAIEKQGDTIVIRTQPIMREEWDKIEKNIVKDNEESGERDIEVVRFETVGPILGKELLQKTLIAAFLAVLGILFYIAWAFKDVKYGISAVVALFHDTLIVAGIFSLFGYFRGVEVDVLFVIALLTTMSFSVHDTIVVFDRIRESFRKENLPLKAIINKALTETMTRSVNNSMTIIFMLLALVLLGGGTIKWFSVALLIGTVAGTYSSPFVATPILYTLLRRKSK